MDYKIGLGKTHRLKIFRIAFKGIYGHSASFMILVKLIALLFVRNEQ